MDYFVVVGIVNYRVWDRKELLSLCPLQSKCCVINVTHVVSAVYHYFFHLKLCLHLQREREPKNTPGSSRNVTFLLSVLFKEAVES